MPWSVKDVERHHKGLTPKKKRQWVHVANAALAKHGDEGRAIREANSVVGRTRAQHLYPEHESGNE